MWDLPGPGIILSPTLAGGFFTAEPPWKSGKSFYCFSLPSHTEKKKEKNRFPTTDVAGAQRFKSNAMLVTLHLYKASWTNFQNHISSSFVL